MSLFNSPWKYQKTKVSLMFSGEIERENWKEMYLYYFFVQIK